jgi:hypothetical protein
VISHIWKILCIFLDNFGSIKRLLISYMFGDEHAKRNKLFLAFEIHNPVGKGNKQW